MVYGNTSNIMRCISNVAIHFQYLLIMPYAFHTSRPHRCSIQKHHKNYVITPTGAILVNAYKKL
jgi:hypothetical protein